MAWQDRFQLAVQATPARCITSNAPGHGSASINLFLDLDTRSKALQTIRHSGFREDVLEAPAAGLELQRVSGAGVLTQAAPSFRVLVHGGMSPWGFSTRAEPCPMRYRNHVRCGGEVCEIDYRSYLNGPHRWQQDSSLSCARKLCADCLPIKSRRALMRHRIGVAGLRMGRR